jgi:hypothetical protein
MSDLYSRHCSRGLHAVGGVLERHKHKGEAWRRRSVGYHLRHAVKHLALHLVGVRGEPHLAHAATRMLMALTMIEERGNAAGLTRPAKKA